MILFIQSMFLDHGIKLEISNKTCGKSKYLGNQQKYFYNSWVKD